MLEASPGGVALAKQHLSFWHAWWKFEIADAQKYSSTQKLADHVLAYNFSLPELLAFASLVPGAGQVIHDCGEELSIG